MLEWLFNNAKDFVDVITLGGLISAGGLWVVHMLLAGRKQVQSLFDQQKVLTEGLNEIMTQMKPNGGSSMFDMMKTAAKKSEQNAQMLTQLTDDVRRIKSYQWNFAETIADKPIWETDAEGSCTRVNGQYAKLSERDTTELTGSGWENFLDPADRERVFDEWHEAVRRRRVFESTYIVRSRSGRRYTVKAVAMPIMTDGGKVVAFIGRFDEVTPLP